MLVALQFELKWRWRVARRLIHQSAQLSRAKRTSCFRDGFEFARAVAADSAVLLSRRCFVARLVCDRLVVADAVGKSLSAILNSPFHGFRYTDRSADARIALSACSNCAVGMLNQTRIMLAKMILAAFCLQSTFTTATIRLVATRTAYRGSRCDRNTRWLNQERRRA